MVTAALLSTGSAPGRPRQTGQVFELGGAPNRVLQPQKSLLLVRSCACTSSPMTGSNSIAIPPASMRRADYIGCPARLKPPRIIARGASTLQTPFGHRDTETPRNPYF